MARSLELMENIMLTLRMLVSKQFITVEGRIFLKHIYNCLERMFLKCLLC